MADEVERREESEVRPTSIACRSEHEAGKIGAEKGKGRSLFALAFLPSWLS